MELLEVRSRTNQILGRNEIHQARTRNVRLDKQGRRACIQNDGIIWDFVRRKKTLHASSLRASANLEKVGYVKAMNWQEVLNDNRFQDLPDKIELNADGIIVSSHRTNWHAFWQAEIATRLRAFRRGK